MTAPRRKYKGLDNRDLRLLNQSNEELLFQKYRTFIIRFQKAPTLAVAANKLKLRKSQVLAKASFLRRKGIALKRFHCHRQELFSTDVLQKLATLAKELRPPELNHEHFVRLWQTVGPGETAKAFGFTYNKAIWICSNLRTLGIPLRDYREKINVQALKKVAASLNPLATKTKASPPQPQPQTKPPKDQ